MVSKKCLLVNLLKKRYDSYKRVEVSLLVIQEIRNMDIDLKKTITYVNPASGRPILRGIHDQGARSFADENINFAEVVEALDDINKIAEAEIFIRAFGNHYEQLVHLLNEALRLADDAKNLNEILLILSQMRHLAKLVSAHACASFVATQLKPFLKEERHTN